jgi:hypothetical protein
MVNDCVSMARSEAWGLPISGPLYGRAISGALILVYYDVITNAAVDEMADS